VEDVEVGVFNSSPVEIRRGKGLSVKGGGVLLIALVTDADKVSVFVDTPVADILGGFCLSFLIKEDDRVEMRLSAIILYPPFSRVVGVLKVASKRGSKANGLRGGSGSGDGRLVLSKADRFVTVDAVVVHVWLSEVKDAGNKE